jgi:hypothetical protein
MGVLLKKHFLFYRMKAFDARGFTGWRAIFSSGRIAWRKEAVFRRRDAPIIRRGDLS